MMNVVMYLLGILSRCSAVSILLLGAGLAMPAQARVVLTCEDAAGERFFSERCPPGTRQIDSRRVGTGSPAASPPSGGVTDGGPAAPGLRRLQPVTVYAAPDCVPCDFVERHLETRRVTFTRVDVEADPAAFETVRVRLETVGVPVLTVGSELLTGFQPQRIDELLVAQGVLLTTDVPARDAPAEPLPAGMTGGGATADTPPADATGPAGPPPAGVRGGPDGESRGPGPNGPARGPATAD